MRAFYIVGIFLLAYVSLNAQPDYLEGKWKLNNGTLIIKQVDKGVYNCLYINESDVPLRFMVGSYLSNGDCVVGNYVIVNNSSDGQIVIGSFQFYFYGSNPFDRTIKILWRYDQKDEYGVPQEIDERLEAKKIRALMDSDLDLFKQEYVDTYYKHY